MNLCNTTKSDAQSRLINNNDIVKSNSILRGNDMNKDQQLAHHLRCGWWH